MGQELLTQDKQVPAFQHRWLHGEILQEKGSGQLGGQWVSGVETREKLRAQRSAETMAASPDDFTPCFKLLATIFSPLHYSQFGSMNHKNESRHLPQLTQCIVTFQRIC